MIRFLLRTIGLFCLAAAFILVIYDGTKSIASNQLYLTSVSALWQLISPASLAKLQPAIAPLAGGVLWDPVDGQRPGGAELGRGRRSRHRVHAARTPQKAA